MDILIVDDDPDLRECLADALYRPGRRVATASDGAEALDRIRTQSFGLVLLDIRLPKIDGLSVHRQLQHTSVEVQPAILAPHVILMTAFGSIPEAVQAIQGKAADYIVKPFDMPQLLERVEQIASQRRLHEELIPYDDGVSTPLIGKSPAIVGVRARLRTIAASDAAVLITGETGTGKELAARMVHDTSPRSSGPFVAVNCAAFPEPLLEAELFGHERGSFTGATRRREGRFEAADGGTLFLDEVGDLPIAAQAKLLRVLQHGTFEPLGTNRARRVDVRLVSASNRNLEDGRCLRKDLLYRINVFHLHLPALRERRQDIPLLVSHFCRRRGGAPVKISPLGWAALQHHPFPGNVRELEHAIEHALVLSQGGEIALEHFPERVQRALGPNLASSTAATDFRLLADAMDEFERVYIARALDLAQGSKSRAAALLGVSRKCLWAKLKELGLPGGTDS
jgi:DNA-binding NtrC family response regulator